MKVIEITKAGGPEVLQIQETEQPTPKNNQVLIQVKACGVNRSDVITRQNPNAYGGNTSEALVPGLEVSGEIIQVGQDISEAHVGEKVCALIAAGGYAEYVTVDYSHCLPVPNGISLVKAASLPETIFTVWFNIFMQANLQNGEKLLIHGGTSGIGTMGLQIAKALGSPVYSTVGTDEKLNFMQKMNLGTVINYKKEKFEEVFKDVKIDVILDMVGGDYTQKNLDILSTKGRLVNINGMNGTKVTVNLQTIMAKNLRLTGSFLKPQPTAIKTQIAQEVQKKVWPLLENKKVKPIIYKTFPLKEASEAHRLMESSGHIGKILLTVDR